MNVKLATPEAVLFEGEVDDLILEGAMGQLNILPRHTNFVSFICPGPIQLRRNKSVVESFEVHEGVVKVEDNQVTLLCAQVKPS